MHFFRIVFAPWTWTEVWGLTMEVGTDRGEEGKGGKWNICNSITITKKKELSVSNFKIVRTDLPLGKSLYFKPCVLYYNSHCHPRMLLHTSCPRDTQCSAWPLARDLPGKLTEVVQTSNDRYHWLQLQWSPDHLSLFRAPLAVAFPGPCCTDIALVCCVFCSGLSRAGTYFCICISWLWCGRLFTLDSYWYVLI